MELGGGERNRLHRARSPGDRGHRRARLSTKVLVNKDRSTNIGQAMKPPGAAKPPADPPTAGETKTSEFPVSIERVNVEKASVDFSDLSLVLPFAAKIEDLSGTVAGLSTDRASRALAKLEGRVDEFGLARIEGKPRHLRSEGLHGSSRRVPQYDAALLYSATFAGRRIASGRLGLDLQYKIDKGALAGDNKVELMKFTLGERIESPSALSLPLDLAIALLPTPKAASPSPCPATSTNRSSAMAISSGRPSPC